LEADGYQPYLISPEKGLKSLIKGVLEMAKEPSRLCVDEVRLGLDNLRLWMKNNVILLMSYVYNANIQCSALSVKVLM
jgi:hypothetical protein